MSTSCANPRARGSPQAISAATETRVQKPDLPHIVEKYGVNQRRERCARVAHKLFSRETLNKSCCVGRPMLVDRPCRANLAHGYLRSRPRPQLEPKRLRMSGSNSSDIRTKTAHENLAGKPCGNLPFHEMMLVLSRKSPSSQCVETQACERDEGELWVRPAICNAVEQMTRSCKDARPNGGRGYFGTSPKTKSRSGAGSLIGAGMHPTLKQPKAPGFRSAHAPRPGLPKRYLATWPWSHIMAPWFKHVSRTSQIT